MLCKDVKRVLYFFLDGSVSASTTQALEIHQSNCPDCEVHIVVHRKFRSFIRKRLSPIHAPETLRVKLTQTLRAVPAES